jgi:Tol biopolymer transport system component
VTWTRDGRYLLFAKGTTSYPATNTVFRVPVSGGEPQRLALTMEGRTVSLRVHPDGRRLAFTSGERNRRELWVLENLLAGK